MRPSRPYHAVTAYHREPGGLRRLDFFVDRIMQSANDRNPNEFKILDIGCGNGNIAVPLAALGFSLVGVDLSDVAIKAAKQAADEAGVPATFIVGGLDSVASKQFDAIICSEVLEHQSDVATFLDQLKDKLAPHGTLFLSVPNGQSLEEKLRRALNHSRLGLWLKHRIKKQWLGAGIVQSIAQDPHLQFYSYKRLSAVLRQAGFWIIGSDNAAVWFKEFFYLVGRAWIKRGSRFFHASDSFDGRLCAYWPRMLADGWLMELKVADERPLAVQLIPTLGMGGAERIVLQLAKLLPNYGYASLAIAHVRGGDLEKEFKANNLPYIILPREGFLKRWRNFWALRRQLIDLRPAVVNTHLFGSDFWGRLAARSSGLRKIVTTEHNVNADFSLWRTLALRLVSGLSLVYIAITQNVKRYLMAKISIPEKKIKVIYNGLDLKRIKTRSGSLFHDVPKLIFVGRLEKQKNLELVLKALEPIKRPWQLTVVGVGSEVQELKDLADSLKIAPRVHFLGVRDDVPDLLAQHDLFVFPSRWEGFGLAVIEAAAAGVPVLTADLPVLHELMADEQVTFLPLNDQAAWTKTIESALADPAPWVAKAQHAAAADWSRFSEDRMAAQYAEVYRTL
ncbi:MAG: glycosyltransferase [Patescibacteria group bacterium]